jgi:hypothetical protein
MSIRLMSRVWEDSPQKGGDLIVLLALADWANDEGHCWPSMPTLAAKARMSERNVQKILTRLKDEGEIEIFNGGFISGQNRTNTYKVTPRQKATTPPSPTTPPGEPTATTPGELGATPSRTVSKEPSVEPSAAGAAEDQLFDAPPASAKPADALDPYIDRVWEHYFSEFGDRIRVKELTSHRRKSIRGGLVAVGGENDPETATVICCRAISGLKSYRRDHPDGHQGFSVDDVFTTSMHTKYNRTEWIERWAAYAKENVPSDSRTRIPIDLVGVPSVTAGTIRERRRDVARMYDHPGSTEAKERGTVAVDWLREHVGHQPKVVDGELRGWELVSDV